jgi:hypothetical protein
MNLAEVLAKIGPIEFFSMVSMNPIFSKYLIRAVSKYLKNLVLFTCLKESISPQATGISTLMLKSSKDFIYNTSEAI